MKQVNEIFSRIGLCWSQQIVCFSLYKSWRKIKDRYRLIVVDLTSKKELDADPKAIQQIEFVGQLKNVDGINADGTQSMFFLTIFE